MPLDKGTKPIEYYKDANGTHPLFDLEVYGVSSFIKTLLDDDNASEALSTLGVSDYIKTLLDDADAETARNTLETEKYNKIRNADGDSYVEVTDDDVIHFYRVGSEIGQFNSNGLNLAVGKGLVDADGDTYITVEETADEDVIHFYTAGSERVTIDDSNLTILNTGSSSGEIYLSANVNSNNQNSDSPRLNFTGKGQTAGFGIQAVNVTGYGRKDLVFYAHNSDDYTAYYEIMRIKYNGIIKIVSGYQLQFEDDTHTYTGRIRQTSGSGGNLHIDAGHNKIYLNWYSTSGNGHAVTGNGSSGYGVHYASEFHVSSDKKLKTDIADYDKSAIDIVKKFKIKKYKMINDNYKREHIGLIAQDIQAVLPEIVEEVPDPDKETTTLTHSLNDLIFLNIKAIQELEDKLNNLQEQINDIRQSTAKKSIN